MARSLLNILWGFNSLLLYFINDLCSRLEILGGKKITAKNLGTLLLWDIVWDDDLHKNK